MMNTSADVSKFKIYYFMFKCWILLKPVLKGLDGNLHFPVLSMNRLNQTEPATFSILPCWAFFRDSVFIYFTRTCQEKLIYISIYCNIRHILYPFSSTSVIIYPVESLEHVFDHFPTQRAYLKFTKTCACFQSFLNVFKRIKWFCKLLPFTVYIV
jgi:hypothetical protein